MLNRWIVSAFTVLVLTACASATPEQQVIDDAASALGGASHIKSLKSLTIQGTGSAPNAGQNRTPDDELPKLLPKLNELAEAAGPTAYLGPEAS